MNYYEKQQERFKALQDCLLRMGAGEDPKKVSMEAMAILTAARMEKPRNCDVGTDAEQHERVSEFCRAQSSCGSCPVAPSRRMGYCRISWAQMPYEKGSAVTK